jgi:hypothetical protein
MPRAPAPESQRYLLARGCILTLRRRVVGDPNVMHYSIATADGDRESIGKNLLDERGDGLRFRGAVGAHESVPVGMPFKAFKRDGQVAVSVVHDQDERSVRT